MENAFADWSDFNVAVAGAGAALAGLLIVAMSVNIAETLNAATLPARAGASVGTVMLAVAASCLALVPGQPVWLLGAEVLAGAGVVWLLEAHAARPILREPGQRGAVRAMKVLVGALPPAVFTAGAALLAAGADSAYAWVAAGSVLAFLGAVLFSWIALVENHR
ncbi:hypothetical protein HER39_09880 [Arthrobacter deserti]|uniref:Modulator of FtsH protease n=1 Tax=Arthrobacter deserti TaxID=1742687 RepID=A0ABX1JR79_9MICC|nr:hypothetical protein [Arthrobacter deserti]